MDKKDTNTKGTSHVKLEEEIRENIQKGASADEFANVLEKMVRNLQ